MTGSVSREHGKHREHAASDNAGAQCDVDPSRGSLNQQGEPPALSGDDGCGHGNGHCEECDSKNNGGEEDACRCEGCDCDSEHHGCQGGNCADGDGHCGGCCSGHDEEQLDTSWFEEHAPTVDTPTPDEIVELVVACVNFVRDALGIELDFTPETLPILDHYLLIARESLADRIELRELVWRCAGAYFGELVRRRYNGFWSLPNPDVHTWRLNQRRVLLSFNPVGVVAEAMAGSDKSDGPTGAMRLARADQDEVARRLAEVPPLPEDQFYLLSTRLEVIDTVVEHLRIRLDQNDQADIEFDPDDYARDLEPYGIA